MLIPLGYLLGGIAIAIGIMALVVIATFFSVRVAFAKEKSSVLVYEMLVVVELAAMRRETIGAARTIVATSVNATQEVIFNAVDGSLRTLGLILLVAGALLVLVWQDSIVTGYLTLSQCGIAPFRDKFVLQVVNLAALAFDVFNPLWTAVQRFMAAITFVPLLTGAACADTSILWDALQEVARGLRALLLSLVEVITSDNPVDEPIDLTPAMYHFGKAFDLLTTTLHCVCGFFDFLWVPVLHIPSFTSIHVEVDCLANIPVAFLQMLARPFAYNGAFTLIPLGETTTCGWIGIADILQDLGLQVTQIFTGVFSEILTPCDLFNGNAASCNALGHCSLDEHTQECRGITTCDAHATRDTCVADSACCFDAFSVAPSFAVNFHCDPASEGFCPAGGNAGCAALPNASACSAFAGVCLWDVTANSCNSHEATCAEYVDDASCRAIPTYCNGFVDSASCTTQSDNICLWTGSDCISRAQACIEDVLTPDPNVTCAPLQLCGWNYNMSVCVARDLNATLVQTVAARRAGARVALNVPGKDAPPDTIGKLIGVPVVLAALEVQWAHTLFFPGNELFAFVFMTLIMVIESLIHAPETFGQYDGLAKLRIGYLFDFLRSWISPVTQFGLLLDVNIPCALQPLSIIPVDAAQGIIELFFLVIFFPIYQPTGPADSINLWSPFDFLASYWNDTKISFRPLIFVNGEVPDRTFWDASSSLPDIYAHDCFPVYPNCALIIDLNTDIITVNGIDYTWGNVADSGTLVTRVNVFPGIDHTIPHIIEDIKSSSACLERVVGDGSSDTEEDFPWACALKHFVNVFAEILSIVGQVTFYVADFLRFTQDPVYRRTPRDVYIEGFYNEWRAMSRCIANMIRLLESGDTAGPCKQFVPITFELIEMDTFVCCLARFVEIVLSGAILTVIHEATFFARDLLSIKFILADGSGFYLPSLTAVLDDVDSTTDALACAISAVIPDSFQCPLEIVESNICTVFTGNEFVNIPCHLQFECKRGNSCLHKFISSILRLLTTPFRIVDQFYGQLRAAVTVQCHISTLQSPFSCGERPPCIWTGMACVSPNTNAIGDAGDIVELIVSLIRIPLGSIMRIGFNFALLFDCITCAIELLNTNGDTCSEGTPFFDFAYDILGVLFSLLNALLTLIVSLVVMLIVLIVAAITGDFALITETFDVLGAQIAAAFTDFGKRLLVAIVRALHLDELYNGVVDLINKVIIPVCMVVRDVLTFLNNNLGTTFQIPDCTSLALPPLNTTGLNVEPSACINITVESFCDLLPNCIWDGVNCTARVGCGKGITREDCTSAALEAGSIGSCYWRVAEDNDADATDRSQTCHNASDTGFPACAAPRSVPPECGNCAAFTNNAAGCLGPGTCSYVPIIDPPSPFFLGVCDDAFAVCNTDNCGCHTYDSDRDGCADWPGVCFWLPGTSECVNSYSACGRPNHVLLNDNPSAPITIYHAGGAPVTNNFCALALDLCFGYPNSTECNDPRNHNQCQWVTGLTQTSFYNISQVPGFGTSRNLTVFDTVNVDPGACVSRVGYPAAVLGQVLDQSKFSCVPRFDGGANVPHYCVPIDTSERLTAFQTVSGATYSLSLEEPMKRKRFALMPGDTIAWAAGDACGRYSALNQSEMSELATNLVVALVNGTYDSMASELYCVGRVLWQRNITGASVSPPGQDIRIAEKLMRADCDTLFKDYYNVSSPDVSWETLRPLERVHLTECVKWRLLGDYARSTLGYSWLPSDLFYNSLRKWQLLAAGARGYSVYRQYTMDRTLDPELVLSAAYRDGTEKRGIVDPVLRDASVTDVTTLKLALDAISLHAYFVVNNLTDDEYAMTLDLATAAAGAKGLAGSAFADAFAGFMRNATKPVDFWGMLANGSRDDMQRVFTTSVVSVIASSLNATGIVLGAAVTVGHYKRAAQATQQFGKLITNGFAVLSTWLINNNTFVNSSQPGFVSRTFTAAKSSVEGAVQPMLSRWGTRVRAVNAFLWRNAAAGERRAKFAFFGLQFNYTLHDILIAELRNDTATYRERVRAETHPRVSGHMPCPESVRANAALIDLPPCLTNTSTIGTNWFCCNCPVGDGIIGRTFWIIIWLGKYYTGSDNATFPINFPNSYNRFKEYAAYLSNDTATVRIGGSVNNPLLWPYSPSVNISNWAPLGDSAPNKTRFYDYGDLLTELFEAAKQASSDPKSLLIVQLIDSALNSLFVFAAAPFNAAARASGVFMRGSGVATAFITHPDHTEAAKLRAAQPRPPGEILTDILELLFAHLVTCSSFIGHEGELDGRGKRFAIAEILGIVFVALMIFVPFLLAASVASSMALVAASMVFGMIGGMLFLSIVYNWSFLCSPALPPQLADDVRDTIGYTVQPKCPWFAMGTLREDYTGNTCYTCAQARSFTSSHCVRDWKFFTIFDNLAFTTIAWLPDLPETLTELGLGALVNGTSFGDLLVKWQTTYVPEDRHNFAALWTCNGFWTLWPHIFLIALAIHLLRITAPFFAVIGTVIAFIWLLAYQAFVLLYTAAVYIMMLASMVPFIATYGVLPETVLMGPGYTGRGIVPPPRPMGSPSDTVFSALWRETKTIVGESALAVAVSSLRHRAHGRRDEDDELELVDAPHDNINAAFTRESQALLQGLRQEHV